MSGSTRQKSKKASESHSEKTFVTFPKDSKIDDIIFATLVDFCNGSARMTLTVAEAYVCKEVGRSMNEYKVAFISRVFRQVLASDRFADFCLINPNAAALAKRQVVEPLKNEGKTTIVNSGNGTVFSKISGSRISYSAGGGPSRKRREIPEEVVETPKRRQIAQLRSTSANEATAEEESQARLTQIEILDENDETSVHNHKAEDETRVPIIFEAPYELPEAGKDILDIFGQYKNRDEIASHCLAKDDVVDLTEEGDFARMVPSEKRKEMREYFLRDLGFKEADEDVQARVEARVEAVANAVKKEYQVIFQKSFDMLSKMGECEYVNRIMRPLLGSFFDEKADNDVTFAETHLKSTATRKNNGKNFIVEKEAVGHKVDGLVRFGCEELELLVFEMSKGPGDKDPTHRAADHYKLAREMRDMYVAAAAKVKEAGGRLDPKKMVVVGIQGYQFHLYPRILLYAAKRFWQIPLTNIRLPKCQKQLGMVEAATKRVLRTCSKIQNVSPRAGNTQGV